MDIIDTDFDKMIDIIIDNPIDNNDYSFIYKKFKNDGTNYYILKNIAKFKNICDKMAVHKNPIFQTFLGC